MGLISRVSSRTYRKKSKMDPKEKARLRRERILKKQQERTQSILGDRLAPGDDFGQSEKSIEKIKSDEPLLGKDPSEELLKNMMADDPIVNNITKLLAPSKPEPKSNKIIGFLIDF